SMTRRFLALSAISLFMVAGCATSPERAAEIAAQRAAGDALEKAKQDPKADNLATDRASVQRRREQVAALLNKNRGYSNYLDDAPMLVNAGFAGPLTYGNDVFVKRETVYCASAEIVPLISDSSVRVVR